MSTAQRLLIVDRPSTGAHVRSAFDLGPEWMIATLGTPLMGHKFDQIVILSVAALKAAASDSSVQLAQIGDALRDISCRLALNGQIVYLP